MAVSDLLRGGRHFHGWAGLGYEVLTSGYRLSRVGWCGRIYYHHLLLRHRPRSRNYAQTCVPAHDHRRPYWPARGQLSALLNQGLRRFKESRGAGPGCRSRGISALGPAFLGFVALVSGSVPGQVAVPAVELAAVGAVLVAACTPGWQVQPARPGQGSAQSGIELGQEELPQRGNPPVQMRDATRRHHRPGQRCWLPVVMSVTLRCSHRSLHAGRLAAAGAPVAMHGRNARRCFRSALLQPSMQSTSMLT